MNLDRFQDLPDDARVWIHGFAESLTPEQRQRIGHRLEAFCSQWLSHSEPVQAVFDIWLDRFAVTAAWCAGGVSGCSTDSFIRNFKELGSEGLNGLNGSLIFYRDEAGALQAVDHLEFDEVAASGRIHEATPVFDTLITDLATLRQGRFEVPFGESWHRRRFRLPSTTDAS